MAARARRRKRFRVTNAEISQALEDVGNLLEIKGDNPFKIRAYANAARTVRTHGRSMESLVAEGADLTELPGIGEDMAAYIEEMVRTGGLERRERLAGEVPLGLLEVLRLPGVGPKSARKLWKQLKVTSLEDLRKSAERGEVADLKGFGARSQERMLAAIERHRKRRGRFLLADAEDYVEPLLEYMHDVAGVEQLEVAGSYRRRRETVGDIDLLVVSARPETVIDRFVDYPAVADVRARGEAGASVILSAGLQVDMRVVGARSYGAALVYFTGSKAHNIALRRRAQDRGLRISEYGVFRVDPDRDEDAERDPWSGRMVAGATEKDVYRHVDLPWIPPELREDRGEIDAAEHGRLPALLSLDDIRGDLQMHTTWSDGHDSVADMVAACAERGYEYLAITDHGKALPMIGGLDADRLRQQWKEIDEVAEEHPRIHVLKGMEVDVLEDGSLDLEDELLEELDIVFAAVHTRLNLSAAKQTRRIVKALEHPAVHVLAHPTGRLINRREPMRLDLDEVLACAAENGVAVEVDAQPDRLDLDDGHLIEARRRGLRVVIDSDAHRVAELDFIRHGVDQARRGWLQPGDVLNTLPLKKLLRALREAP